MKYLFLNDSKTKLHNFLWSHEGASRLPRSPAPNVRYWQGRDFHLDGFSSERECKTSSISVSVTCFGYCFVKSFVKNLHIYLPSLFCYSSFHIPNLLASGTVTLRTQLTGIMRPDLALRQPGITLQLMSLSRPNVWVCRVT